MVASTAPGDGALVRLLSGPETALATTGIEGTQIHATTTCNLLETSVKAR